MALTRWALTRRAALAATATLLATPHIARAQSRRLRVGHNNTTGSTVHVAAVGMDQALRAATDGRLGLEIVPNSALGGELQMLDAVAAGTLDMMVAPGGTVATLNKEVGLIEAAYLFGTGAQARAAMSGALGRHCSELVRPKGVVVAAWTEIGFRQITANKPVRGPADLKGLKIRVPVSQVIMEGFKGMGAQAEVVPFPDLPEALRTGRLEAQENPLGVIIAAALNRFQSHLSLTRHVYTSGALVVSADVLDELSAADQRALMTSAEAGRTASYTLSDRTEADGLETLRAAGMTVVTDVDLGAMRTAAAAAREMLTASFGADAIRRVTSLAA